jgi:transposase
MEPAPVPYRLFVGIDIAATSFVVVCRTPGPSGTSTSPSTLPQTPAGFATLQQRLYATKLPAASILVVMEATGSYWMRLATALVEAGFVVSVINPS